MKFLVAFVMIAAVSSVQALTSAQLERLIHNYAVCAREIAIDPELISNVRHGEYTDSEALKEYLFCLGRRAGLMDRAGGILKDALLEWTAEAVGQELANELIGACAVMKKSGPETTYHVVKCIHDRSGPSVVNII